MKRPRPTLLLAFNLVLILAAFVVIMPGDGISPIGWIGQTFITTSGGAIVGVNVQSFNASGSRVLVQTTTSGSTLSGATAVSIASPSSAVPGLSIWIPGAGSAGGLYQSTVTAVNGNTLTLAAATSTTVANGTYVQVAGPVTTTTSGSTTSGSTVITVASTATFAPLQGIYIAGAGASSANYTGIISSVSNGAITVSPATGTTVSNGTLVQHDDSVAFQNAVNSLAVTGGVITVPDGIYLLNAPPQNTGTANCIVQMPTVLYLVNTGALQYPQLPIAFQGITMPGCTDLSSTYSILRENGAIIQSAQTGCAIIGGYSALSGDANMTNVMAGFKNLTFRVASPANESSIEAQNISGLQCENITCDTTAGDVPAQPSGGIAIDCPASENDGNGYLRNINITGQNVGIRSAEHLEVTNINFFATMEPIVPIAMNSYGFQMQNVVIANCPHVVYYNSNTGYPLVGPIHITNLNFGNAVLSGALAWTNTQDTVYDPNNQVTGELDYTVSPSNPIIKNGGQFIATKNLAASYRYVFAQPGMAGISNWAQGSIDSPSSAGETSAMNAVQAGQVITVTSPVTANSTTYINGMQGLITQNSGSFAEKSISCRLIPVVQGGTWQLTFGIGLDNGHWLKFQANPAGNLVATLYNGSSTTLGTVAYNPSTEAYLLIYEHSGTTFAKYSATGAAGSWTSLGSVSDGFTMTSGVNVFAEGNLVGDGNYDGYGTFDQMVYTAESNR